MNSQAERAEAFRVPPRQAGDLRDSQSLGRGFGQHARDAGIRGAGNDKCRLCILRSADPTREGAIGREETLANARAIVDATSLPVSADLENGFGDDPDTCAETILLAAAAGLVGGSIEDATGRAGDPIYAYDLSVAAGQGRGECGTVVALSVRAHRESGEPDQRTPGPAGHDSAPRRLCRGGGRCSLCSRA